jgi:uncharacterized peroxidase-related enzyme
MPPLTSIERADSKESLDLVHQCHFNAADTPNFLKVLAKSLSAMRGYEEMENALASGELSAREREQIALAVAEIDGSITCLAAHSAAARNLGLTEHDIQLAREARGSEPRSDALLAFTLAVVAQRGEIKGEDLKRLRAGGFSESETIEIVANIAINIFTNYVSLVSKWGNGDPPEPKSSTRAA